ncbi:MAG: response regulator transcription factor [Actinomycetota bacterium]|nr:response regulator transcription factor [Actinomycetota bacterium]
MNILLVDDSPEVRRCVRRLIERQTTFTVVAEAGGGEEALEMLSALRPQVVVTDVNMPGIDGVALTREIKRLYPSIQVLALSSCIDFDTRERMREAGASGYIVKGDERDVLTYELEALDQTRGQSRRTSSTTS